MLFSSNFRELTRTVTRPDFPGPDIAKVENPKGGEAGRTGTNLLCVGVDASLTADG